MRSVDTYMTIDAAGNVSFDFEGHISADGIDMLAGDSVSPPLDRRIRWHETTLNGPVVAEIYSYKLADVTFTTVVNNDTAGGSADANIQLTNTGESAALFFSQEPTAASASTNLMVTLDGVDTIRTIIDGRRRSHFLQLGALGIGATPIGLRAVMGTFRGTDAAILQSGTGGWSVVRNALGTYTVTFTQAFTVAPMVVASLTPGLGFISVTSTTTTTAGFQVWNSAAGLTDGSNPTFLAVGGTTI